MCVAMPLQLIPVGRILLSLCLLYPTLGLTDSSAAAGRFLGAMAAGFKYVSLGNDLWMVELFHVFHIHIYIYMDIYIIWIYVYIIYMWSCRRVIVVYRYKWPFTPTLWAIHLLMDDSNPSIGVSDSYLFQPLDRCDKPLDVARHMALLYTVCTICTIYIYLL